VRIARSVAVNEVQLRGKSVTSAVASRARNISDGERPESTQNSVSFAKSVGGKRTATTEVFITVSRAKKPKKPTVVKLTQVSDF
jgi:hypothetical protein